MVALTKTGEVCEVNEADQFQPARTQFACGFFACAIARSMAPPGQLPTLSVQQIIADAEQWYAQYDGTDAITNMRGMTDAQLYNLLAEIGLHYQSTATDMNTVKGWLHAGYPLIGAVTEVSVRDLALGDGNPYPWNPAGTHIILITGVAPDGNLLVRDSANCTDLHNPGSLRPGPRHYDAAKLQLVSATVAVPPWLPRPVSATPPAPAVEAAQPAIHIPAGWTYNAQMHILTASNGIEVKYAPFVDEVLKGSWNPIDVPLETDIALPSLEDSNPSLGAGVQQIFRFTMLGDVQGKGVIREWIGQELLYYRERYAALYKWYDSFKSLHIGA